MAPPATAPQRTAPSPAPSVASNTSTSASAKPDPSKASFANEHVTQDRARSWKSGQGRSAVIAAGAAAQAAGDGLTLSVVFQELIQAVLDEVLAPEELGSAVKDILASPSSDALDPVQVFIDTFTVVVDYPPGGKAPESLSRMLIATEVDPALMRKEWVDHTLVALDNIVRHNFPNGAIRHATQALYAQSNYNLLREESEGYSKLITEYFTTVQGQPPSEDVVKETFQRVNALIGTFDLDVGRCLDVTLDVFANLLVKHTRFFVKFLRTSSWWPEQNIPHHIEWEEPIVSTLPQWALPGFNEWYYSDEEKERQNALRSERDIAFWKRMDEIGFKAFFELGARRITRGAPTLESIEPLPKTPPVAKSKKGPTGPSDFQKIRYWSQVWMAETQTLPPPGNRTAAQLLGFKLRFYASGARDEHDTLPPNLIDLAALLIKIGFISLVDLYPHLYPLDEDMEAHREKLLKAKREKETKEGGVPVNALAMAGALPDDTLPPPAQISRLRESESKASSKPVSETGTPPVEEEPKAKLPEPSDQKVALLRSLLAMGAIPEALFILGRFPWLLEVYPDLHKYMFRLAHHSLSKLAEWARPFPHQEAATPKHAAAPGGTRASDYVPRRTLRWAKLEEKDAGEGISYRFYWDDWADNVPICQNVDDVFKLCTTLLKFIGPECGHDAVLLTNLARIGRKSLAEDSSPANTQRWRNLTATLLAPALSFSGRNPAVVNEMWDLIKRFDTATRYQIYGSWFTGSASRLPIMKSKAAEVLQEAKRIMGRISKENTREMGRLLAKPAYANPGFIFEKALATAETYDNMTEPLVECCRYLTFLGYDCLNWAFINSFQKRRPTVQGDGMLAAPWLKNIAYFIGKAYKRYGLMDPTPVLQSIADQLLRGKLFMMEVFEQMLTSMAGIGPVLSLTESQVYGLSGGPLLRAFTLEHYLGDMRHISKGSAKRLLKCLRDAGLAAQILVALAIELERFLYREEFEDTPLKVLSTNYDNLHSNFMQYLDFLRTSLPVEEFDALIPGVVDLLAVYGVSHPIAFAICRPSLAVRINNARAAKKQANGDVSTNGAETTPAPESAVKEEVKSGADAEMKDVPATEDVEMKEEAAEEKPASQNGTSTAVTVHKNANAEIEGLASGLRNSMPNEYGEHVCLNFYVTFWQLSLVDIFTVTPMKEMNEYKAASKHFAEKARQVPYDRRDLSAQAVKRRTEEQDSWNAQGAAVRDENSKLLHAALKMREYLQSEMASWFDGVPMVDTKSDELHITILQDCFLPRILLTPQDAQFSAAMLKFMHEIGVPGFRTMKFLDQLFRQQRLTDIIFSSSQREALNFGRFLNDVLKDLNVWHSSQASYTKLAYGKNKTLPGFGRTFNPDRTPATFLDYEDFRRVLFKWHTQLYRALETCFKSDEYMNIRNAINVMKAIAPNFPKIDTMGKSLYAVVQEVGQKDSREDLKLAALSVLGDIKRGDKQRMSHSAFSHSRNPNPQPPPAATRSNSDQAKTPQAQDAAKKLNASAPEFNPRAPATNGAPRTSSVSKADEDGEVKDERKRPGAAEPRGRDAELATKPPAPEPRQQSLPHRNDRDTSTRPPRPDNQQGRTSGPPNAPPRPDTRDTRGPQGPPPPGGRLPHNLPPRPEQPSRPPRIPERVGDYNPPPRLDPRTGGPDYGRLGRVEEPHFGDRRDMSPGRRHGRTPEHRDASWQVRDPRDHRGDPRDHYDERMRPPRETRGPVPPPYHPRDSRDMRDAVPPPRDHRDARERDSRPPLPPQSMDNRAPLHSQAMSAPDDQGSYRRDYRSQGQQGGDRPGVIPSRGAERSSANATMPTQSRIPPGPPGPERGMINPDRAALIGEDRGRGAESFSRPDGRHDRGSRPQSPRRGHDRTPSGYPSRNEMGRDYPQDRTSDRPPQGGPPQPFPSARSDRREDPSGPAPTGPRGGSDSFAGPPPPSRLPRDAFMPQGGTPRPSRDPNYGRLNQPTDAPSGPRSMLISTYPLNRTDGNVDPASSGRLEPPELPQPSSRAPQPAEPTPTQPSGDIHPSRLAAMQMEAPANQTTMGRAPSGPRGPNRAPSGPATSIPMGGRGPPTGPAGNDRNQRPQAGHMRAINNINSYLGQSQSPNSSFADQNASGPPPPIRGRGAARAGGSFEATSMHSPANSSSHPGTPNAPRPDIPPSRSEHTSSRYDNRAPDDGSRYESRSSHRESRRSERSGGHGSERSDRGDKRSDDQRSSRSGPSERPPRAEDQERGSSDRGHGRERRSERESSRRERSERDAGDPSSRESGRRERSSRDDPTGGSGNGRTSSRAGGGERSGMSGPGGSGMPEPPAQWGGDSRGDGRSRGERSDRRRDERGSTERGGERKRGPPNPDDLQQSQSHRDKRPRRSGV